MHWIQEACLDSIDRWACGDYWIIRETGIVDVGGRLDGLIVPVTRESHCMKSLRDAFFDRFRLCGIELKTNRADFLRGQKIGQFERYDAAVSGLYVATIKGVCKTSELPNGVGHLIIDNSGKPSDWNCVCKRHPKYKDPEYAPDVPWRILFKMRDEFLEREIKQDRKYKEKLSKIGREAGAKVFSALDQIQRNVENECDLFPEGESDE